MELIYNYLLCIHNILLPIVECEGRGYFSSNNAGLAILLERNYHSSDILSIAQQYQPDLLIQSNILQSLYDRPLILFSLLLDKKALYREKATISLRCLIRSMCLTVFRHEVWHSRDQQKIVSPYLQKRLSFVMTSVP